MHTVAVAYLNSRASPIIGKDNYLERVAVWEDLTSIGELRVAASQTVPAMSISVAQVAADDVPPEVRDEHRVWDHRYFTLTAAIDVDVATIIDKTPDFADVDPTELAYHVAVGDLGKAVGDLTLAANLSRPGCFEVWSAVTQAWGRTSLPVRYDTSLINVLSRARELEWPPLLCPSLRDAWNWLQALPEFDSGLGVGRVGRAVAALSYLAVREEPEGSPADLTWALVGLEALYGRGIAGLKEQIVEKSAALLGRPQAHRKRFNGIYDYRSRFVHGDLDMPLSYGHDYTTEIGDRFGVEVRECEVLAAAVLVATLQHLVTRGWHSLEFAYIPNASVSVGAT